MDGVRVSRGGGCAQMALIPTPGAKQKMVNSNAAEQIGGKLISHPLGICVTCRSRTALQGRDAETLFVLKLTHAAQPERKRYNYNCHYETETGPKKQAFFGPER